MTDITAGELVFDYASIPDDSRDVARDIALDIKPRLRRAAEDVIAIGNGLIQAKAALPHGFFGRWAYDEFGLTAKTTERFVGVAQLAERMGAESDNLSHLLPSVLYELAKPSTPAKAVEKVIDLSRSLAETGERVTVAQARREIRRLRQPTQPQTNGTGKVTLSPVAASPGGTQATAAATCRACHRQLTDPDSIAAGIGHTCAQREQMAGGGDGNDTDTDADEPRTVELVDDLPVYGLADDDVFATAELTAEQKRGARNILRTIGYGIGYLQPHPAARELGIEQEWQAAWEAIQALVKELEAISQ